MSLRIDTLQIICGYTLSDYNLNACIHAFTSPLYSMLREYKGGLERPILRNSML